MRTSHRPARLALATCAAAVLLLGLAGCGDDAQTSGDTPDPAFADDGTLAVDDFNAYLDDVDGPWETDAAKVAIRFAHPVVQEGEQVGATLGSGDDDETVAVVLVTGLADDSVADRRTAVALTPDGDRWRLVRATWTQRCKTDRGHEDWSTEPCV